MKDWLEILLVAAGVVFTRLEIISFFPQTYSSDEQSLRVVGDGVGPTSCQDKKLRSAT